MEPRRMLRTASHPFEETFLKTKKLNNVKNHVLTEMLKSHSNHEFHISMKLVFMDVYKY